MLNLNLRQLLLFLVELPEVFEELLEMSSVKLTSPCLSINLVEEISVELLLETID